MNLFELFVKVGVDDQASNKLSSITGKLGNGLKTAAKIGAAAVSTAAAGITALTTAAVKNYAKYEQLVGGVETLFKNNANTVQKNAENAYKTAGLSANEYMETVTSFSASLLQSLDGDTKAAAKYADMAISDMSDNANKMGTDMGLIQNAYQGFAKQNYTMLDNLKLGYGGTKEEMERLISDASKLDSSIDANDMSFGNIVKSINAVQKEMGIYGTTALEAENTISGSLNTMQGAWSNLITGISDDNADFGTLMSNMVESVGTFTENLLPRIEIALGGIANLISQLAPIIIEKLPELFSQILPKLLEGAVSLIQSLAGVLPSLINTLVTSITSALPTVINALVDALFVLQSSLIDALPSVIQSIVAALPSTLKTLINGSVKLFESLIENLDKIIKPVIEAIPDIIISLVSALTENLPSLIDGLIQLTLSLVEAIPEIISGVVDSIPTIVSLLIQATFEAIPQIIAGLAQVVWQVVLALPQICYELVQGFINVFVGAWDGIKEVFSFESVGKFFSGVWSSIKNAFGSVVKFFGNIFSGAWKAIKNAFSGVGKFFGGIWDKIVGTFKTVGTKVADAIGGAFKSAINAVIATVEGAINLVPKAINGAIGLINKLPGVEISKIPLINLPRLERGGVLKRGQIGLLEGNGAEAVVPLERHTGWINRIAEQLDEKMQYKQSNAQGYSRQSVEFKVGIDDKANAMGLARALLPLLKVAEKEMYV